MLLDLLEPFPRIICSRKRFQENEFIVQAGLCSSTDTMSDHRSRKRDGARILYREFAMANTPFLLIIERCQCTHPTLHPYGNFMPI